MLFNWDDGDNDCAGDDWNDDNDNGNDDYDDKWGGIAHWVAGTSRWFR